MESETAESLLPIEMWEKVFQLLGVKDALNCRLVCSAWRMELDGHFDKWTVRLDQNSQYFQHFLQLKVKEVIILDLKTPVDMGQEGTQMLFKHPELLEKLSISQRSDICPENLLELLIGYAKTIKHINLDLGHFQNVITDPTYNLQPNGFEFANLESLSLKLDCFTCPRRPVQQFTLFKLMVGLSTMRKIKSLKLIIKDVSKIDLCSTILEFLEKNGTTLEEIDFCLHPNSEEPAQLPAIVINRSLLSEVQRLKRVGIEIHYGIGVHNQIPLEFEEAWSTLLQAQRHLTHLNLSGLLISLPKLTILCQDNQNTLTKVELWSIDFDIDLAIFVDCMYLKELSLHCKWQGSLLNARSLPVGIQKFQSSDYLVDSEDILAFFVGHGELVEIRLEYSGCGGSNGVTAALFSHLVINRDLSNKLMKLHIVGFNRKDGVDTSALNKVFRSLDRKWKYKEYFCGVGISIDRTRDEGGDWSVWRISTF